MTAANNELEGNETVNMLVTITKAFRQEFDQYITLERNRGVTNPDGSFKHKNDFMCEMLDKFAESNNFKSRASYKDFKKK